MFPRFVKVSELQVGDTFCWCSEADKKLHFCILTEELDEYENKDGVPCRLIFDTICNQDGTTLSGGKVYMTVDKVVLLTDRKEEDQ